MYLVTQTVVLCNTIHLFSHYKAWSNGNGLKGAKRHGRPVRISSTATVAQTNMLRGGGGGGGG